MVRCTNCGHRWFVPHDATGGEPRDSTDVDRPMQAADDDTLDRGAVDQPSAPPPSLDRSPELAAGDAPGKARREPATARSTGATLSWLAVLLMLLILTGLVLGRNELVGLAPQTAPIYQRLGLPVTQAIGLELSDIVSERLGDEAGDVLRITGTVRNVAGMERAVPALRIALLDAAREEILVREVEVPKAVLADGALTRFSVDLEDPPTAARNFSITFAVEE